MATTAGPRAARRRAFLRPASPVWPLRRALPRSPRSTGQRVPSRQEVVRQAPSPACPPRLRRGPAARRAGTRSRAEEARAAGGAPGRPHSSTRTGAAPSTSGTGSRRTSRRRSRAWRPRPRPAPETCMRPFRSACRPPSACPFRTSGRCRSRTPWRGPPRRRGRWPASGRGERAHARARARARRRSPSQSSASPRPAGGRPGGDAPRACLPASARRP
jgi:hypothetical protein